MKPCNLPQIQISLYSILFKQIQFKLRKYKTAATMLFVMISLALTFSLQSQELCYLYQPCREISGPEFPGGETLCEINSSFNANMTISNGTYASNLLSTTFYSRDILIQGLFYIDVPVSMYYCRVKLAAGAQIIVTSEMFRNDFLAFHTKFFSCTDMWKGIILETGVRCRLYYCDIEDAQYAITVEDGVSLALHRNVFNRNFVSITNSVENQNLPFLLFNNNTFDCTSELSDYYDLNFTCCNEDLVSFAGILLNNCSSSIGYYNSNNIFNNLNYGIFANNSVVNIKGCKFIDAQTMTEIPDLIQEFPFTGCGIAGLNSTIFLTGNSTNKSSIFKNADLFTEGCNLQVTYAEFEDSSLSASESYSGQTVIIENNKFNGLQKSSSIDVERSMASGSEAHTNINYNILNGYSSTQITSRLIGLFGRLNPTDIAIVDQNVIKFIGANGYSGIYFAPASSENSIISDNYIQQSSNYDNNGITVFLGKSFGSTISNNTIIGSTPFVPFKESYGVKAFASQEIKYCLNTVNNLGYGLAFIGSCHNSQVSQNQLDTLNRGLQIRDSGASLPGIMGVQYGTRNAWLQTGDNYDPSAAENTSSLPPSLSQYNITTTDFSNSLYNPTNVQPTSGWFRSYMGGNELCSSIDISITGFDSLILNSDVIFEGLSDPVKFYLKKNLINTILGDPYLTTTYSSYLLTVGTDSEFLIADAELNLKDVMQMDLTDQHNLDEIRDTISWMFDSISIYDAYNYANIDSVTFTEGQYFDSLQYRLGQITTQKLEQQDIIAGRIISLFADLDNIQNDLENITPRAEYDSDYIEIYTLFIKKIVESELDQADYDVLNGIAQNFADSSLANATAMSLFDLCSEYPYPDYLYKCEEESPLTFIPTNKLIEIANDELNIEYFNNNLITNESISSNGTIFLHDITGKLIWQSNFDKGSISIPVNQKLVPPGIYYYLMLDTDFNKQIKSGIILIVE